MPRTTLTSISKVPFPQNYIAEVLGTEADQCEVPADFVMGLQPILSECMTNGSRSEKIIRLRYECGLTYAQVAKEIGVQKERIRYIIRDSQRKLRQGRYRIFLKEGYLAWQKKINRKSGCTPNS